MAKRDSIFDIIKNQPKPVVDRIYGNEKDPLNVQSTYACKAVFQSLTMLSKCYVMRMMYLSSSFPLDDLSLWVKAESKSVHDASIDEMIKLRVLVPDNEEAAPIAPAPNQLYKMNQYFQSSFKRSISDPKDPWTSDFSDKVVKKDEGESLSIVMSRPPTAEWLNQYSISKWNDVLGFIVNILPYNHPLLKHNILKVFVQRAELMKPSDGNSSVLTITSKGYEYMLKDYRSQVWEFVLTSIRYSAEKEEALSFLFMLSYCELGKGYPVAALTKAQRQLMFEFSQLGVIYLPSLQATKFYPTGISIDMIFTNIDNIRGNSGGGSIEGGGGGGGAANAGVPRALSGVNPSAGAGFVSEGDNTAASQMRVIVETNNQVVAYVTSELHLAMLRLFVDVSVRMPNMAIGKITREKAKQAFRAGIKAVQIVDFLLMHAHPNVRNRVPIIPENVTDQLTLWEAENHRIHTQPAVVVDFREVPGSNLELFRGLVEALNKQGVLVYQNSAILSLGVKPEGFPLIQTFFREKLGYFSY